MALRIGKSSLGLVAALAVSISAFFVTVGAVGGTTGGLEVRSTQLESTVPNMDGTQTVKTDLAWTTEEFPGVYECTWTASAADGSIVGTYSDEVISLWSDAPPFELNIPVTAPAAAASGTCSATRLDVGGKYEYQFSDVSVEPVKSEAALAAGESAAAITFDAKWMGSGQAGPVTCTLEVRDSGGDVIITKPMTILFADGNYDNYTFTVDEPDFATTPPTSADVTGCEPFTHPSTTA